jgi:hypothetical protein
MAGSNGVYPYFDAPVVGIPEDARKAEEAAIAQAGIPVPRYSSLLMSGVPRGRKRAVLVLEESEEESALRIAKLRGHHHDAPDAATDPVLSAAESLPDTSVPPVPDNGIIPIPGGPLMAKKPHGTAWDFRDMLAPREPRPIVDLVSDTSQEPEPDDASASPASEGEPAGTAEPGFALLDASLQERLDSLVARPAIVAADEPPPVMPAAAELPGPVWPLGLDWLESAAPAVPEALQLAEDQSQGKSGLWTRLRAWLARRS